MITTLFIKKEYVLGLIMSNGNKTKNNGNKPAAKGQGSGKTFDTLHQLGAIDEKNERKRWKSQNWKEWIDEDDVESDDPKETNQG